MTYCHKKDKNNEVITMYKCQEKSNHLNFLTAYREIWCEACVKLLSIEYENYIFCQTKPAVDNFKVLEK